MFECHSVSAAYLTGRSMLEYGSLLGGGGATARRRSLYPMGGHHGEAPSARRGRVEGKGAA